VIDITFLQFIVMTFLLLNLLEKIKENLLFNGENQAIGITTPN